MKHCKVPRSANEEGRGGKGGGWGGGRRTEPIGSLGTVYGSTTSPITPRQGEEKPPPGKKQNKKRERIKQKRKRQSVCEK